MTACGHDFRFCELPPSAVGRVLGGLEEAFPPLHRTPGWGRLSIFSICGADFCVVLTHAIF